MKSGCIYDGGIEIPTPANEHFTHPNSTPNNRTSQGTFYISLGIGVEKSINIQIQLFKTSCESFWDHLSVHTIVPSRPLSLSLSLSFYACRPLSWVWIIFCYTFSVKPDYFPIKFVPMRKQTLKKNRKTLKTNIFVYATHSTCSKCSSDLCWEGACDAMKSTPSPKRQKIRKIHMKYIHTNVASFIQCVFQRIVFLSCFVVLHMKRNCFFFITNKRIRYIRWLHQLTLFSTCCFVSSFSVPVKWIWRLSHCHRFFFFSRSLSLSTFIVSSSLSRYVEFRLLANGEVISSVHHRSNAIIIWFGDTRGCFHFTAWHLAFVLFNKQQWHTKFRRK